MTAKLISIAAALTLALGAPAATAGSDLEDALAAGATRLSADEIATRIVGKTVSAALGEKRFLFYYSADNVLTGQLVGGGWSGSGYYGITDDDRVCLSMAKDKGRLRCLTLLEQDGKIIKYRTDGSASFEMLEFHDGKTF
ncbi:MAG: hypothetical protein ACE5EU_04710 [Paracoccaceae bacterium]